MKWTRSEDPKVRAEGAASDLADRPLLAWFSYDPCPSVRLAVAGNSGAASNTIERLAEDENLAVREAARAALGRLRAETVGDGLD